MNFAERLNEAKIKPSVLPGGKVGLYRAPGAYSEAENANIEDEFGIRDSYVSQNPLCGATNNLVVQVDTVDVTIFYDKSTQKWAMIS